MANKDDLFKKEYERLKGVFADCDEKKLALLDGSIVENVRLRCQIDELNKIIAVTGTVKIHPTNPLMQKELPVAKELTRLRASYTASCKLLCRELGGSDEKFDDDMSEFE